MWSCYAKKLKNNDKKLKFKFNSLIKLYLIVWYIHYFQFKIKDDFSVPRN